MKTTNPNPITEFLSSTERTFEIPVYQRNYVWKVEDCEKLFDDVLEGFRSGRKHYFGNIVYYVAGEDPFSSFKRYILIDGQQRITTTMLLLAAIRDEEQDEAIRQNLSSTYLRNDKAEESFRVKLKQVETDRTVYESIVEGHTQDINKSSIIYRNYSKFRSLVREVKNRGLTSADLMNGIKLLDIIAIDLESEKEGAESPQVIFESINATGEPLSTADLLRNFLLLEAGVDRQAELYQKYWLAIERNVGNENISDFIRRYITLETSTDIKKDTEYKEFKKNYTDYFSDAEDALKKLAKYSTYYRWIKRPETIAREHPKTSKILQDLDDLRMLPATPAIMWLLEKADSGEISFDDVDDTLGVIASWSFRARVTNIVPTGEIGTILTVKILEFLKNKRDDDSYADYILFELSNYRLRDIYPSDSMFREAFIHYNFYKNYRRYVQQKLASSISNDQTEIVLESIEHIMPQSIKEDKWPGISPADHVEWVNTIGNLTPLNMPDNISNSNHSFEDKIENIKNSDWQITRNIDVSKGWGIDAIRSRGKSLAGEAVNVWRGPVERTRDIEVTSDSKDIMNQFLLWIDEFDLPYMAVDKKMCKRRYLRFTTDYMSRLMPKRTEENGDWGTGQAYYYEVHFPRSGEPIVQLAFNRNSTLISPEQLEAQDTILAMLDKSTADSWRWKLPVEWALGTDDGDSTLKDDLRTVLEDKIPQFENSIREYYGRLR